MTRRTMTARLSGAVEREGWTGVSRIAVSTALRAVARVASQLSAKAERAGGIHHPQDRLLLAANESLRNVHRGRRCFVVANGSSLKSQDLTLLAGEITMTMNSFWKHEILDSWQPTYHCLADPVFFDRSEPMRVYFENLRARVTSTTYFVPLAYRHVIAELELLPPDPLRYVAFRGNLPDGLEAVPDFTRTVPNVQSVSQLAIMAAMFLGCSPIYLLGTDHDWLAHRGMDRHFYDGIAAPGHPLTHGRLSHWSYASDLQAVLTLWRGYERIQEAATSAGIEVVNATRGGFLDVFPRTEYETLFSSTRSPETLASG